jgi:hypothetical protein
VPYLPSGAGGVTAMDDLGGITVTPIDSAGAEQDGAAAKQGGTSTEEEAVGVGAKHGYLSVEQGARISTTAWSKDMWASTRAATWSSRAQARAPTTTRRRRSPASTTTSSSRPRARAPATTWRRRSPASPTTCSNKASAPHFLPSDLL